MKLWFGEGVWTRKNTEKTAILRHAAFGDMVLTRRFVLEARKAFPPIPLSPFDIATTEEVRSCRTNILAKTLKLSINTLRRISLQQNQNLTSN